MAERPVNLNKLRKARARRMEKARADANAAFHGLTTAEKARARAERARRDSAHEAGRRERPEDGRDG
jgi:hypothetical protein